jgi:ATP adenylyltransferase
MKFVTTHKGECVFCDVYQQTEDERNLIVCRGRKSFVIVNRYPYTSGHLLVVANVHKASLEDLDAAGRAEMMELATHALQALRRVYQPEAFNLGTNIGKAAGAGIAGHVHLHIVPRWSGDTNFMPLLGETKVVPEALAATYETLLRGFVRRRGRR